MPLKCVGSENQSVFAFQFSREEFEALRAENRARQHLHFTCCESKVGLRISKNGLNHFYHLGGRGTCPYEEESEAHLSLKYAVMVTAQATGWEADCEVSSEPGAEQIWRADVLAHKGNAKVAFEVQLSNIPWERIVARQERYRAAGVRGLWLLGQDNYPVCREVPAFQIRSNDAGQWQVRISPPKDSHNVCLRPFAGNWVSLESFIAAALTKNLVWAPVLELNRIDVIIRAMPHPHCSCGAKVLLPTSLAVSLPFPGYRSLIWTVTPFRTLKENPGPAWLNALVTIINKGYPDKEGALLATRQTRGRAYHFYVCPTCAAEIPDELSRNNEVRIMRSGLPVKGLLPEAEHDTAEWQFLHQWWLRAPNEMPAAKQAQLHLPL
ncbi:competence protein CoiA [Ralstonia pseudosolanacearum]|uniref:competence protein CoiA n=1 Tax=Ralstonia pseudosolanacearum TaxID=1310165 RepID=UPI003CEE5EB1